MKHVAVKGMTLSFAIGTATATATTVLGAESSAVNIDGNGIYLDGLSISLSGVSCSGVITGGVSSVPGTFTASSVHTKSDGKAVIIEGDVASVNVSGTNSGVPVSAVVIVTIQSAGQSVISAE